MVEIGRRGDGAQLERAREAACYLYSLGWHHARRLFVELARVKAPEHQEVDAVTFDRRLGDGALQGGRRFATDAACFRLLRASEQRAIWIGLLFTATRAAYRSRSALVTLLSNQRTCEPSLSC